MSYVIEYLKKKHEDLLTRIKAGEQSEIKNKVELETAIAWLEKIHELKLGYPKGYEFIKLPDMQTGYSEYHLMNDCESGNVNDWIELKDEAGYPITLVFDDILISRCLHSKINNNTFL